MAALLAAVGVLAAFHAGVMVAAATAVAGSRRLHARFVTIRGGAARGQEDSYGANRSQCQHFFHSVQSLGFRDGFGVFVNDFLTAADKRLCQTVCCSART